MSTSASVPLPSASSSTVTPSPEPSSRQEKNSVEASESIRVHAEFVLRLIQEQCALVARAARVEVEASRAELVRVQQDSSRLRNGINFVQGEYKRRADEVNVLSHELNRMREEMSLLRKENAELKMGMGMGAGPVSPAATLVNASPDPNTSGGGSTSTETETEAMRVRCEELLRENERLRTHEANLQQRIEIFESLNASVTLEPTDSLPDLSGVLETLRGHHLSPSGQESVNTKKRRLDETPSD